jgi:hypothetical protein
MDQFDRHLRQWVNEEQLGRKLSRRPKRPSGTSGALGLALAPLLLVMGDCADDPAVDEPPPATPTATLG